jgi:26S proteasome regulatory subunit N13
MDRRDKTIVDSFKIEANSNNSSGGTFERIRDDDRVYLWTMGSKKWEMYWMQDLDKDGEYEILAQVNQYLMNPAEAAQGGAAAGMESDTSTSSNNNNNNAQVDALSNILENLVMPEGGRGSGGDTPIVASAGTLTLADLQGAMAGLQTEPQSTPTTPLSEVVTPAAITSLLQNEHVSNRLLELLPEEQRSIEHLEDNLRSPQIQQTLRALSSALMPDENGSMEGYHSVLANFQLDPRDGDAAMASGNPIQAFLDCILASRRVRRRQRRMQ